MVITMAAVAKPKQLKLGLFIRPCGHHIASWRHPDAEADAGVNFPHFVEMAKTAERGKFDMLFSADSLTAFTGAEAALDLVHYVAWMEPYSLLTALSQHTTNIGLVCTASTSFDQPFHIARRFATLDLISGGRAGWNPGTSLPQVIRKRPRISARFHICQRSNATAGQKNSCKW